MAKRRVHPAPPKPDGPTCPHCHDAYWRYNESAWYACKRGGSTRHVCPTPQAVGERERVAREQAAARTRQRTKERRGKVLIWVVGMAAALAFLGYSYASQPTYHGPPRGTAECEDGTISYSQHRSGTCSWHGGVEAWND